MLLALVGVHLQQPPETLTLAGTRIQHGHALRSHAGIDAEVIEFTDERVGHDLEDQRREGLQVADVTGQRRAGRRIGSVDVPDIDRARQEIDHNVKQRLNAFILERGAAGNRHDPRRTGRATNPGTQLFERRLLLGQEKLHDLVVHFRDAFDHMVVGLVAALEHLAGELFGRHLDAVARFVEVNRLPFKHVDHTLEVRLFADRQNQRNRSRAELGLDFGNHTLEIRAGPVHLVDQRNDRHMVFLRLPPDRFTLRLHLADRTEHRHRTVENAQRTLHLRREVHVSGSVDDVDPVILPIAGGGGAGDRNTTFALLLHPVHRRGTLVGVADLAVHAAVEKNAFRQRGLAGINVRHDADVTGILQRNLPVGRLMKLSLVYLSAHNRHSPANYQR